MEWSNPRECQLFPVFDFKGVGQHDGGAGRILSEANLNQNNGESVDYTLIGHFIAKKEKTGRCLVTYSVPQRLPLQ